jgi:DnaJ-class molecular chaperone
MTSEAQALEAAGNLVERRALCDTCQGNGEIVTDWERYLETPEPGDQGDEGTAICPDCDGAGQATTGGLEDQAARIARGAG